MTMILLVAVNQVSRSFAIRLRNKMASLGLMETIFKTQTKTQASMRRNIDKQASFHHMGFCSREAFRRCPKARQLPLLQVMKPAARDQYSPIP